MQAELLYQQALAISLRLAPNYPALASSLNNLTELYHEQGKYAQAELLYQQALAIFQQLDPNHPITAV